MRIPGRLASALFAISLAGMSAILPAGAGAGEGQDLVFADRAPWSPPPAGLAWQVGRRVAGAQTETVLSLHAIVAPDGGDALELRERGEGVERTVSRFPVTAGDPVVVYFLERVTRDMAEMTGGSPFYIRNRLKEALAEGGEVVRTGGDISLRLTPFAGDQNRARMAGFDRLALEFDFGPDPRRPIRRLSAATAGEDAGGADPAGGTYRFELILNEEDAT